MTLFYVTSLCILLILPKGSIADCSTACTDPQVCDSDNTCKIKHGGSPCSTSDECVKGAECDGTSQNCQCGGGYIVTSDRCTIDVGGSCAGTNSTMCKTGLMCEANKCKLSTGGDCSGANSGNCKSGTSCDAGVCKLNAGGDCSTTNSGNCKSGTSCDAGVCKINAGGDCTSNTGDCKSGTSCQTNVCTADDTYGGTCSISGTDDSCVTTGGDANAVCTNSKCACKSGYNGSVGAKCSGAMAMASSVFLVLAALLIKTHLE